MIPPEQPPSAAPTKGRIARQISSSVLLILGLVLLGIAGGVGYFLYYAIFGEPVTDGLQNVFRLAFAAVAGLLLLALACAGLVCTIFACVIRPWGAQ